MKIRIILKDPDGVGDSIDEAARDSLPEGLSEEERDMLFDLRREKIAADCTPWLEYSEYVTIEIDTDAGTAVVVRAE